MSCIALFFAVGFNCPVTTTSSRSFFMSIESILCLNSLAQRLNDDISINIT